MNKILIGEERLQNFWIEVDTLSGLSYFDAVNAGLEPVTCHYPILKNALMIDDRGVF